MKHILILHLVSISWIMIVSLSVLKAQPGKASANNITIAYESFGDPGDEAILLIQGTGATMLHYPKELCKKLAARGYRVIRFDNRDIRLSTKLDSLGEPDWEAILPFITTCKPAPVPYILLDMTKDVTGLMDALRIDKAHIAGASMGGAIAQLIAINYPERMFSLTSMTASSGNPNLPAGDEEALLAMTTPPPVTTDPDVLTEYLVDVYKALGGTDEDEVLRERALGHVRRSWYPEGINRQDAAVLIADNCDRRKHLSKIPIPAMVIYGDADPLVPIDSGREVAAATSRCRIMYYRKHGA